MIIPLYVFYTFLWKFWRLSIWQKNAVVLNQAIAFEIVWPFSILLVSSLWEHYILPYNCTLLCLCTLFIFFKPFSSPSARQFVFNSKFINEWWLSVWWSFASNVLAWLLAPLAAAFAYIVLYLIACQADLVCLLTRMRWMTAKGEINAFGAISTFSNYRKGSSARRQPFFI